MGKNQHVLPHEKGWQVKGEKNQKATKVFRTQEEALSYARCIAKNQQSELFIHGRNGQIRDKDSHGHDPYPPKG